MDRTSCKNATPPKSLFCCCCCWFYVVFNRLSVVSVSFCCLIKRISPKMCILCVRVNRNKRSFEPLCVLIRRTFIESAQNLAGEEYQGGQTLCGRSVWQGTCWRDLFESGLPWEMYNKWLVRDMYNRWLMKDMYEKWLGEIWVKLDFREKCATGDFCEISMTIDLSARSG